MKRSAIRELTFRLIYSLEIQKVDDLEEQVELYIQCNEIEENDAKEYIKIYYKGTIYESYDN